MEEYSDLRIEAPENYLPDLESWGILDAVDDGVCPNTYENRKIIRERKARYLPVYRLDGSPTDLIQVLTVEMQEARAMLTKTDLLSEFSDPNSDFLTGVDLVLLPGVEDIVPMWVIAATQHWRKVKKERERAGGNPKFRPALASAPGRCRALKANGKRCWNWHDGTVNTDGLCRVHVRTHADDETFEVNARTRARNRVNSSLVAAAEVLEELMHNATSEPVRADAAKQILAIGGIRAGMEIEVKGEIEVVEARSIVAERLQMLRDAAEKEKADAEAARLELEARTEDAVVVEGE